MWMAKGQDSPKGWLWSCPRGVWSVPDRGIARCSFLALGTESPSPMFDLRLLFKTEGIQQTKVQDQLASLGNSARTFRELYHSFSNCSKKHEKEGTLPNSL